MIIPVNASLSHNKSCLFIQKDGNPIFLDSKGPTEQWTEKKNSEYLLKNVFIDLFYIILSINMNKSLLQVETLYLTETEIQRLYKG